MSHRGSRRLGVSALARVEGEAALDVEVHDGAVTGVRLNIYEPPRFFEAMLRGRSWLEPPDLTARICGICPVAYQMSACQAVEDACGMVVDDQVAALRRLLYWGEWIESHTLHIYLLHAPDFLGLPDAIALARQSRPVLERGLALKRAGNRIVEVLGGRPIHPVNIRVGGFYRVPTRAELGALRGELELALDQAAATMRWVASFDFPDASVDGTFLALHDPGRYPVDSGALATSDGEHFPVHDFGAHVREHQVPHSSALHATLGGGRHLVGPLARYALNHEYLAPTAAAVAREVGLGPVCRNPFRSIVVRAVEVLHAVEDALCIIDAYQPPETPYREGRPAPTSGHQVTGHGATEAPRGLLYHRYTFDADGLVTAADIVPPTAQNQPAIEADLTALVTANLDADDAALTALCERAIRNYDPCISCAAHFLDLRVHRR